MRNSPQKTVLQKRAEYADFLVCIVLPSESHIDRSLSELMVMQLVCLSRTGRVTGKIQESLHTTSQFKEEILKK